MENQKPKKALRGLFSRTEPELTTDEKFETLKQKKELNLAENIDNSKKPALSEEVEIKAEPIIEKKDIAYTVTKIQYNFDRLRQERNKWDKNEYITFLNRIDNAQTEAFFLKGRLIGEIKERFYEGNRMGWKNFCDENLNMNYTTANQYIRVAEEFEASSRQRTDFGFEHFKALLPIPSQERNKILESLPTSVSVKSLRNIVSKTLSKEIKQTHLNSCKTSIRYITENLEKIKLQLETLNLGELEQSEKWSLLGAFKNLSEEMSKLSEILSKPTEPRYNANHLGTTSALIEDEYAT
jgi:hypothetical protein